MDYKALFLSAQGRIGRKTYWLSGLALGLVSAVLQGISWAVMSPQVGDDGGVSFGAAGTVSLLVLMVVSLVIMFVSIMLGIKRCHDRDRSGWFVLVCLIPIVGPIWLLVELGFLRGTIGPNQYGPDPIGGLTQVSYAA